MKTNNLFNSKTISLVLLMTVAVAISCKKSNNSIPPTEQNSNTDLTKAEQTAIAKAGFSTNQVVKKDGGYLVEGDIFLTPADLQIQQDFVASLSTDGPKTEQYRTTNIVGSLPRVLKIKVDAGASQTVFTNATTEAIKRYNDQGLKLSLKLLSSTSTETADIVINGADLGKTSSGATILGQSAGFPKNGNPASPIKLSNVVYNKDYNNNNLLATVVAHEIGHAIGFRHTDYADRNYSCGFSLNSNEKAGDVGAIYIPGTPKGGEPGSFMLACSDGSNRPFTKSDIIALKAIYPVK
ncbi:protease B [Pedobacter sp. PAMC26386]|nr:protease B [Pedobacter sp. PAMC26386]